MSTDIFSSGDYDHNSSLEENLEKEVKFQLARMIAKEPEKAKGWTNRPNMQKPKPKYTVKAKSPTFVEDGFFERTERAHAEVIEEKRERFSKGLDLWTIDEIAADTEQIDEPLTEKECELITKVMLIAEPCENRKRLLTGDRPDG